GTREAAAVGNGDRDHARRCECPRLRPPPRRDPPRHQAREHPVPGRTGGRRRFRDRARTDRGRGLAPDGDGVVPRHAAVHEPRAGHRRPRARRAQRHLLARRRALRDARGRAAPHRPRAPGVAIVPWALAVLATGAAAWAWLRPAPRPPAGPVVRFSLSFENGFQPTDFRGSPIALAPDGSRIVYAGTDSLGTRWLF